MNPTGVYLIGLLLVLWFELYDDPFAPPHPVCNCISEVRVSGLRPLAAWFLTVVLVLLETIR